MCLHFVKVQSETRSWGTGRGISLMHTYNIVSFNDAFLVRYIFEGPTRNRCQVTAIDIIGRLTPNLDPEVFCCNLWSKKISYLIKHLIWPKYGILSQRWHQTILNIKMCVLSTLLQLKIPCVWLSGLNHWMKSGGKPNDMIIPILTVHCINHIWKRGLIYEYSQSFCRVTPNMCIVYLMRNDCLCWLFLVNVDIIRGWLPQVTALPFWAGIELGRRTAPSTVFSQP